MMSKTMSVEVKVELRSGQCAKSSQGRRVLLTLAATNGPACNSHLELKHPTSPKPPQMGGEDQDVENASDEEIFAELEKEIDEQFDMSALREQRLEELKQECASVFMCSNNDCLLYSMPRVEAVKGMKAQNYGNITEITDEKEVLKTSA